MLFLIPKVDTQELTTIDYKVTEIWSCCSSHGDSRSQHQQPAPPSLCNLIAELHKENQMACDKLTTGC